MNITQEEFEKISKEISNEEVPELLFSILLKINDLLTTKEKEQISDSEAWRIGLFKVFFKQYNTILVLSRRVNYIFLPSANYIDLKSIYTLIRSCHELYLTFRFLSVKSLNKDHDENDFKYLCYQLSGELDNKRTFEKIKNNSEFSEKYKNEIPKINKSITNVKQKIKQSPLYGLLKNEIKDSVLQGHWKFSAEKKLSWNDLLDYTPMSRTYGSLEYHTLSMYAHSSHASLQLEAQHDYNMVGTLAHLYKLTSLMCYATAEAYLIPPENFTTHEIVIMKDLATMGE